MFSEGGNYTRVHQRPLYNENLLPVRNTSTESKPGPQDRNINLFMMNVLINKFWLQLHLSSTSLLRNKDNT